MQILNSVIVRHPKLVVTVPTYNEERFLRATLESVRGQSYRDFSVLVSDNASSDATGSIAQEFVKDDPRFHYVRHDTNIGAVANFNFCLSATQSEYFMWLGSHDTIAPSYLEKALKAFEENPGASVVAAHTGWIDEDDAVFQVTKGWMDGVPNIPMLRYVLEPIKTDLCAEINNVLRRRSMDGFRMTNEWGTDNVLLAHLAYRGKFYYIPEPLYHRRDIKKRAESYMKRLTGVDRAEDRAELIDKLVEHLHVIARNDPLRPAGAWFMRAWLTYLYDLDTPSRWTGVFRIVGRIRLGIKRAFG